MKRSRFDDRSRYREQSSSRRPQFHHQHMPLPGLNYPVPLMRGMPAGTHHVQMEPYGIHMAQPPGMGFHPDSAHHSEHPASRHQEPPRKKLFIAKDELSDVAKDCIERIADSKKYVSVDRIEKLVLQHYSVSSLAEIDVQKVEHIASIREHIRTQAKVNAYIQAFVKCRVIATLHELEDALREFVAGGKEFSSLQLGPLTEQPLVYDYFRFPPDGVDILPITALDILQHLRDFLTENNLWTKRTDLQDFMKYMTEKRDVKSPYELGVRITSIGLAIQVLKRAQRDASQAIQSATKQLKDVAENNLCKAFDEFTRSIIDKDPGYCSIRREYPRMPLKQLIEVLLQKLNVLYTSVNYMYELHHNRHQLPAINKTQMLLHKLLDHLRHDKLLQKMFQFAVCCSTEQIHLQLKDILGLGDAAAATQTSAESELLDSGPIPLLSDVVKLIKIYLERCLTHGSLSLLHLARIENKLLEEFDFPHFFALGYGTFLDVVAHNSEIKQFLEDSASGFVGLSSASNCERSTYLPSRHDLHYFIWQCGTVDKNQLHSLEDALCYHYCSPDVKSLGHGSVSHLLQNVEHDPHKGQESCVLFESALVARSRNPCLIRGQKVGIIGHTTKDKALACLQNCPLLEDLHEWSLWDMVFQPELGDLKDFIQKYGGSHVVTINDGSTNFNMTTSVLALETRPGVLLKITSDSSPDMLASALHRGDVRETCGHLVSVVVTNKGIENTGLILLGNHVKMSIIKMQADKPTGEPTDGSTAAAKFVLDCLTFLPKLICLSVAEKVFLEPLSQVVGQTKSRELLMMLATSSASRSRLQILGMVCGFEEWGHSFQDKMTPPQDCVETLYITDLNDVIVVGDESDDECKEDEESEQEIDDILSEGGQITRKQQHLQDTVTSTKDNSEAIEDIAHLTLKEFVQCPEGSREKGVEETRLSDPLLSKRSSCKSVIDQIRREEFGIDVVLSEDGEKLMLKQQERLGRSLDRLSKDLYSKDTHFVLELIQNADDNVYPQEMYSSNSLCRPSVKFIIEASTITVLNNECGFLEKNIRALCDVGRTTKGKHKYGYIGQKGIGFKSVFRVTDRPEIHSNGYHICFDVNSGPSGYILPHWIDAKEEKLSGEWTTRIVLPLKPSVQTQSQSLAAKFHDVCPSLLLFLHRIKSLSVVNKVEDYNLDIERFDVGNNIIQIKHSKSTDTWFVVRKTLDAQKISIQAKSGVDVDSTEIAMAFPLVTKEQLQKQFQPPKQPVFAFLPLRSYGFRFVIQADFDVPSSRENIDRDSLWNQWLISELHTLFIDAFKAFKEHPEFSELEAVSRILQFVPLEDEILDFFRPVAARILKQLQALPCLPAAGSGKKLTWKLPSQLIMSQDAQLHEFVPSSVLRNKLGLDYLHPEVAAVMNPTLLASLGVQKLTLAHLIEIHRSMLMEYQHSAMDDDGHIILTAKWLTCVYRTMDEFQDIAKILEELRQMPTVPLINGKMVALENDPVFFPPDPLPSPEPCQGLLPTLYQDLNTVHPLLLQCQDSVSNSQVSRLLDRLGVKRLTPHDIVHHHILPVLETDQWKSKSQDHLVAFLTYIKTQLDDNKSLLNINHLKEIAVIMTSHGPVKAADIGIHFTPLYLNRIDLEQCLPGYDWVLLDPCYLAGIHTQALCQQWREFFIKLGVSDFFSLKPVQLTFTKEQLMHSPWACYEELIPDTAVYRLTDMRSVEAEMLICKNTHPQSYLDQMRMIFEILDQNWESFQIQNDLTTQLFDNEGQVILSVDTSFVLLLKSACWIPAITCSVGENAVLSYETKAVEPQSLYIQNDQAKKLLGNHVPYVDAKMSTPSTFAQFLGIQSDVTVDLVRDLLTAWCQREDDHIDEPASFTTSINHMKAVYQYLYDNLPPKQFHDLVYQHPVIFVSQQIPPDVEVPVEGVFLARHEVRWSDPSGLFTKYKTSIESLDHEQMTRKPELAPLYADMADVFIKVMAIEPKPSLEAYTQLMLIMSTSITGAADVTDMLTIVSILGHEIIEFQPTMQSSLDLHLRNIKLLMGNKKCLLEKRGHAWISLNDRPMIADNPQLEKMFRDYENVYFIECGERSGNQMISHSSSGASPVNTKAIKTFYEAIGLEYLSQCIEVRSVTEMYTPCPSLQAYVSHAVHFIQRLLVAEYPEIYSTLQVKGIGTKLAAMTFVKVSRLERVYTLKYFPQAPIVRCEKTEFNVHENQFIVHEDYVNSCSEINKELASYFSQGDMHCCRQLKEMLSELHSELRLPVPDLCRFADEHDLQILPEHEQAWTVPERLMVERSTESSHSSGVIQVQQCQDGETHSEITKSTMEKSCHLAVWPPNIGSYDQHSKGRNHDNQKMAGGCIWPPPKPAQSVVSSQVLSQLQATRDVHQPDGVSQSNTVDDVLIQLSSSQRQTGDEQRLSNVGHKDTALDNTEHTWETCRGTGESVVFEFIQSPDQSQTAVAAESSSTQHRVHDTKHSSKKHVYLFGPPMWTSHADDNIYEEIGEGSKLRPPDRPPLGERPDRHEIAMWGEALVKRYLEELARDAGSGIRQIIWLNEEEERAMPYDLVIKMATSRSELDNDDIYVEVKATESNDKAFFEISSQQFEFAQQMRERYHIYRVFGAGKRHVRLTRLVNLAEKMRTKHVQLFLVV